MKNDAGKYDSYSDGGLPNGPRQEPAPPRATAESERRDQLYKVWLNYNQLPGNVLARQLFDSACAILAPRGVSVASAGNALSERDAFEAWFVRQHIPDPADREEVFVDPSWAKVIEDDWTVWQARAALASQSTPVAPVVEQAPDLMQVARDVGLRSAMHAVDPTTARALLARFVAALAQSTPHVPAGEPIPKVGEARPVLYSDEYATPRAPEPAASVAQEPVAEVYRGGTRQFGFASVFKRWLPAADNLGEGTHLLYAVPRDAPVAQEPTYSSTQATNCAGCGKHKHTPLRVDAMGGYVCLTCIDRQLEEFFDAAPTAAQGLSDAEVEKKWLWMTDNRIVSRDVFKAVWREAEKHFGLSANRAAQETK